MLQVALFGALIVKDVGKHLESTFSPVEFANVRRVAM